ncbi:Uma2 family endonuclease [Frigoriglobus tundricola]|nr:Uma2 family endonuclease [Frigoriglobus tundricola]
MTAEEFGLKHSGDHVEFMNGEVEAVPMAGGEHGIVTNWIAYYLTHHIVTARTGRVFATDTFVKVPTNDDPERVSGADACYVSYSRLAKGAVVPRGVLSVIPDLVVEARSPFDTWSAVIGKMLDYLRAGVPVVVILDPQTRSASVFRDQERQQIFEADDALTVPAGLPGLSIPVGALFA